MSQKTYVIRSYSFGYNDETFYVSGSAIHSGYDNEATAQSAYAKLERDNINNFLLHERDSFFNADDNFLEKVDAFIFEKTGEHIVENGETTTAYLPVNQLNDEDLIKFIKLADLQTYKLIAFDGEPTFYALWICKEETYLMDYDEEYESVESVVSFESKDALIKELENVAEYNEWNQFNGTLEELSSNPLLLQKLIDSDKSLKYNENKKQLKVGRKKSSTYAALNELLKSPLFEIRSFSLPEILKLQEEFGGYMEY